MAQVIRKFLSGGKPKPTIIKIDGKDRNYDDIERDVWGNFDTYAQQQGWDNATQLAVREYLDYVLPGLKSGNLTYGHNTMNGVSEDWQSDGSFNTSGKGIFKKDITTDKRAGATLGTAYLNRLFTDIIPEYKAPELKNIGNQITLDIVKKIVDNNFGGNESAFTEGWTRLTPLDRYTIFRLAISDLNYDENEYKDVTTFNTNRDLLLLALGDRYDETNGLNQSILNAYSKLGGYGLELLIKGQPKTEETVDTTTVPTMDDMRKKWREDAINAGYHTELAIADYIKSLEILYNKHQDTAGEELKLIQDLDLFTNASKSLDNYIKDSKNRLFKNYYFNRLGVSIDNDKLKKGDSYNFSKFSEANFRNQIKILSLQFRLGKLNAYMWRGVLSRLMSHKEAFLNLLYNYKNAQGGVYIIPGTEDMDSESVIVFNPNSGLSIRSIHDFPEVFAKSFNLKFRNLYKLQYQIDLPEDWYLKLYEASAAIASLQSTLQVLLNKNGGILFAQDGAAFMNTMINNNYSGNLENDYWNQVHQSDAQKQLLEIDEANKLGITVEELRKLKADLTKKLAKVDAAIKHGQSTTEDFADYDIAGLIGMAGDIASTIGALTGGAANPVTWGGGLTSLGAYTYADIRDPRVSKLRVAGNFLGNTLLSAAGLIPEIGSAATIARLTKRALTYGPALYALAKDVPAMKEPVSKLLSGKDLTNDDWMAIANGIRAISTGTRVGNHAKNTYKYTTKGESTYLVKTNEKGWQNINKDEFGKIQGKKAAELSGILSEERASELGALKLRRNKLTPWKNESRKVLTREVKSPRRLKTYEEVQNEYGRVSKAYTNMVRDAQAFSNLGVTLKTNRFTKRLEKIGYKSNVTPEEYFLKTGDTKPFINRALLSLPKKEGNRKVTLLNLSKENKINYSELIKDKPAGLQAYVKKDGTVLLVINDPKHPNKFLSKYNKDRFMPISTEVETSEGRMSIADAFAKGKQIKFEKFGGILLNNVLVKYQHGGNIVGNVSSNNSSWHDLIFSLYFNNLYEGLKSGKFTLDDINAMQDRHLKLWAEYDPNKGAYVGKDNVVGGYQKDIIDKYGFVNLNGINNATGNYLADNVFGGLTDDRRILGRNGDFTQEQLSNYNNKLKDLGLEIYLDDSSGTNSGSAYYKLRKLQDPTSGNQSNGLPSSNGLSNNPSNHTFVDPITGETLERQPDGTYKAVGNNNAQTKSQIGKVGEDIWKYVQNINPADAIALGRALWGENVNNRVADITKKMGVALLDPQRETAILHGNYNAKMLAELLAGKINAAALKPISSDAGTQLASKLEAATKATEALRQGNLEDSEMYWKTLQILNQVNNENAANEVATGNENRSRVTAAANNRLQVEAARLAANFEQIWNPYFSGIELNMRNEDTLRRQAEIDSWKYAVTDKYQKLNDEVMERYRTARLAAIENWKSSHTGSDGKVNWDGFDEYWTTDANGSRKYQKELQDISRAMHKELYEGLSRYYGYEPFILKRAPETTLVWRTPGINGGLLHYTISNKSGGTLSAADRQALKTTNEINKNIRAANRETFSNIRQDKREHRKAMALVSLLSADLIKKAIGIK